MITAGGVALPSTAPICLPPSPPPACLLTIHTPASPLPAAHATHDSHGHILVPSPTQPTGPHHLNALRPPTYAPLLASCCRPHYSLSNHLPPTSLSLSPIRTKPFVPFSVVLLSSSSSSSLPSV
ncbi:hypothetical protein E2C01_044241 [Portunus trituberculatus]|uniref:Uncharacterized protein n=1 Tax=Portunus trituberculatus TaxID=210409 RepID=A0A5B7FZF8_PORTR|nr:hypothetical protein [Portunus trituberculatus]